MFLNVSLSAGQQDAIIPKTPEILNSLISLTSPPLPHTYTHYQGGTAELLSPDCSTPGEDCAGWGHVDGAAGASPPGDPPTSSSTSHQRYSSSSQQLTPTSDGSPPPSLTSYTGGGGRVPELSSPICTVEATRSALIKEGLKLQITTKLQQTTGVPPPDLLEPDNKVIKIELTPEDEERRRRRRERNKLAATKCRNKKKEMTVILISESETVEEINARLKGEVQRLKSEKDKLQRYLSDVRHRSTCKYVGPPSSSVSEPTITSSPSHGIHSTASPSFPSPTYSSSSYCSSTSPYSFTSLLSPSDSKDFVTNITPATSGGSECFAADGSVASTASSLECIEPTIPLDTAASSTTTKLMTTSKCKVSPRYHPYLYTGSHSTHGSVRQDLNLGHHPSTSHYANASQYTDVLSLDSREYYPAGTVAPESNNCASSLTEDIKNNPFRYPSVSGGSPPLGGGGGDSSLSHHQQEFTPLEVAVPRGGGEYRGGRARHPSAAAMSRYSPYSAAANHEASSASMASTATDVDVAGCSQYGGGGGAATTTSSSPHHNPFFPPCTYTSNL